MSIEAMKQALEALEELVLLFDRTREYECLPMQLVRANAAQKILRTAIAEADMQRLTDVQQEMEPESDNCVYKATTEAGETAHFGVLSAARAWAKSGTVEVVPLKKLKLVQKPCLSCESLARTVMLDQTYHDTVLQQLEWVGLTEHEVVMIGYQSNGDECVAVRLAEAMLKEKNA